MKSPAKLGVSRLLGIKNMNGGAWCLRRAAYLAIDKAVNLNASLTVSEQTMRLVWQNPWDPVSHHLLDMVTKRFR